MFLAYFFDEELGCRWVGGAFFISVIRLRNFGGGVRRDTHQQLLVKIFPEIFAPKKSTFLYGKLLLDPLHG